MEETNSAQKIVNEALKDESWDIGVNKIAALLNHQENRFVHGDAW